MHDLLQRGQMERDEYDKSVSLTVPSHIAALYKRLQPHSRTKEKGSGTNMVHANKVRCCMHGGTAEYHLYHVFMIKVSK